MHKPCDPTLRVVLSLALSRSLLLSIFLGPSLPAACKKVLGGPAGEGAGRAHHRVGGSLNLAPCRAAWAISPNSQQVPPAKNHCPRRWPCRVTSYRTASAHVGIRLHMVMILPQVHLGDLVTTFTSSGKLRLAFFPPPCDGPAGRSRAAVQGPH